MQLLAVSKTLKQTILLAEDHDIFNDLLSKSLIREGFKVISVASGTEAINQFKANLKIDLVITDLIMPGKTGLEVVSSIRKISDVPIVIITGNEEALDKVNLSEFKLLMILSKPFASSQLNTAIEELLFASMVPVK